MQKENQEPKPAQSELSEVWQELLGGHPDAANTPVNSAEAVIPTLSSDPWSELQDIKGVEIVDLQKVRLQMSDSDMEEVLSLMQEQTTQDPQSDDKPTTTNT